MYQLCLNQIHDHTEIADSFYPTVRGASFSNISTLDLNVRQLRRSLQIIQVLPPIPPPYSRRAFPEFSFRKCKQFSPAFSTSRSLPEHKYQADSQILFNTLFTLHCTNSPHALTHHSGTVESAPPLVGGPAAVADALTHHPRTVGGPARWAGFDFPRVSNLHLPISV